MTILAKRFGVARRAFCIQTAESDLFSVIPAEIRPKMILWQHLGKIRMAVFALARCPRVVVTRCAAFHRRQVVLHCHRITRYVFMTVLALDVLHGKVGRVRKSKVPQRHDTRYNTLRSRMAVAARIRELVFVTALALLMSRMEVVGCDGAFLGSGVAGDTFQSGLRNMKCMGELDHGLFARSGLSLNATGGQQMRLQQFGYGGCNHKKQRRYDNPAFHGLHLYSKKFRDSENQYCSRPTNRKSLFTI